MKIHIVELSEKNGAYSPDPGKVVARVKLGTGRVEMEILNPEYDREVREIFSKPFYAFTAGMTTPEGEAMDAELEAIEPWDSRILPLLPEKLSIIGLDYLLVEK